ncbi:MAG: patatin-like phospholipase family protein [Anaerolineae bacterium]|nr:patatin-like phospholipase family protein [Anaerolineae bacterium]
MPKTALVLSGGGAKGAFQMMAEKYAREVKGYHWDIVAGVSAGALNGTMIAMGKYARLEEIWRTVTKNQIYKGNLNLWALIKMAFGAKSALDNRPLEDLLTREIDPAAFQCDLRVGAVSLRSGEYVRFKPTDPGFAQAVLASTAIPLMFKPVNIAPDFPDMVDGGVRNVSPLGDVLDEDPDEVIVINCNPSLPPAHPEPFKNALAIGLTALDIAMNEIFITDLSEFLRINHNVQEAAAHGVILHNEKGKPYKFFQCAVIEPDDLLGDLLDLSPEMMERRMQAGWDKARQVLG